MHPCMQTLERQVERVPPAGTGREKEQAVQRMFSSIARYYDLNNSLLSLGLHHYWKRQAVAQLASDSNLILDLGAGTADLALVAARSLNGNARIVAADLNLPMLKVGSRKVSRAGLCEHIVCVQATAERICAGDAAFDGVITGFCIRNVGNLSMTLQEICRILKPGGRLVCLEFSRPVFPWLRRLYDWYSFTLLPWVGRKVSGDKTGVYSYLPASIRAFPDQEGLATLMRESGFATVVYRNMTGGIVAIHTATK